MTSSMVIQLAKIRSEKIKREKIGKKNNFLIHQNKDAMHNLEAE